VQIDAESVFVNDDSAARLLGCSAALDAWMTRAARSFDDRDAGIAATHRDIATVGRWADDKGCSIARRSR
jgi:hypothetical protein